MNYRHIYHAGNFADVVKHCILIELLTALKRKDAPFCYLDTHAGIGLYSLRAEQAQRKQEYDTGVMQVINKAQQDPVLSQYLDILKSCNQNTADLKKLAVYPGSPAIARACLRPQDRMVLCELHPEDYHILKSRWRRSPKMSIHHLDGYSGLKAFIPPVEKRGVVLIDPPFEKTNEFETIITALTRALKAWRGGHFMIWYPIKSESKVKTFHNAIKALEVDSLIIQFRLNRQALSGQLSACGITLVNPPWQLDEYFTKTLFPRLSTVLDGKFTLDKA